MSCRIPVNLLQVVGASGQSAHGVGLPRKWGGIRDSGIEWRPDAPFEAFPPGARVRVARGGDHRNRHDARDGATGRGRPSTVWTPVGGAKNAGKGN